jgi:hypothetical protein
MRRIFPLGLLATGLLHCAGANAEDAKPCEDGAAASVSGTVKSIDHILAWWVTLDDGSQGTCKVTVVSLDKVPPECKVGAKLSASGKIIDVDIFDQMILDEVENLKCQ